MIIIVFFDQFQKESLDGENDMNIVLMVYFYRDCEVIFVLFYLIKEIKVNLVFNYYKENIKSEFFVIYQVIVKRVFFDLIFRIFD